MTQDEIRKLPHKVVDGIAIALTQEEIELHNAPQPLEEIRENLKIRIKNHARDSILKSYPEVDQRNILMSGDASAISEMNKFITNIRESAAKMKDSLKDMTRKELENININF